MAKNDIVLIDNPTIMGIQQKLTEHDDRFDEINEKLDEHDQRFDRIEDRLDRLEVDMQDVKAVLYRIQDALLPHLDKLAAL